MSIHRRIDSLKDDDRMFVGIRPAAEFLGMDRRTLERLCAKGSLASRKIGGSRCILLDDFRRWVGSTGVDPRHRPME